MFSRIIHVLWTTPGPEIVLGKPTLAISKWPWKCCSFLDKYFLLSILSNWSSQQLWCSLREIGDKALMFISIQSKAVLVQMKFLTLRLNWFLKTSWELITLLLIYFSSQMAMLQLRSLNLLSAHIQWRWSQEARSRFLQSFKSLEMLDSSTNLLLKFKRKPGVCGCLYPALGNLDPGKYVETNPSCQSQILTRLVVSNSP